MNTNPNPIAVTLHGEAVSGHTRAPHPSAADVPKLRRPTPAVDIVGPPTAGVSWIAESIGRLDLRGVDSTPESTSPVWVADDLAARV